MSDSSLSTNTCHGVTLGRFGVNVRSGPAVTNAAAGNLAWFTAVTILGISPDSAGGSLRWMHIRDESSRTEGWIREDYIAYQSGACDALGLADRYAAPMREFWWIRGFNLSSGSTIHWGWDLGADEGQPIVCGPAGGLVIESFTCKNCTSGQPNTLSHGLQLNDSGVLSDPNWGFGYGHYIIVRYLHDTLPAATRASLSARNLAGAHLFVMYAHLNSRTVSAGQTLTGAEQIGACGNSGNSEAAHLHLEVRASTNPQQTSWVAMRPNLLEPEILFARALQPVPGEQTSSANAPTTGGIANASAVLGISGLAEQPVVAEEQGVSEQAHGAEGSELCKVQVRGIPESPQITEVNVRSGPGTNHPVIFKTPVGTRDLRILAIRLDDELRAFEGKTYQWFELRFANNSTGWIRDDLLSIYGDCGDVGYEPAGGGSFSQPTFAFPLVRNTPVADDVVVEETAAGSPIPSGSTIPDSAERVRKAAFNITERFEGRGYSAYQDYDAGLISYGRFQFTLAASSLERVLKLYLAAATSATANQLRGYLARVENKDPALRDESNFEALLIQAASEPAMQNAQNQVATEDYWNVVQDLSIKPRNIQLPLSHALIFDMGINFGTHHGFFTKAEEELDVAPRSRVGENGITEEQLITRIAELRKQSHDNQAARDNLPGLKVRGDFWVNLIEQGDWQLQGDADGNVLVKTGVKAQVRNP